MHAHFLYMIVKLDFYHCCLRKYNIAQLFQPTFQPFVFVQLSEFSVPCD